MSVIFRNVLEAAARLQGVWAAGLLQGDRSVEAAMGSASRLDGVALNLVWRQLADALDVSVLHRLPAQEMRWIFEHVLVYCLRRSDGKTLALIIGRGSQDGFDDAKAGHLFEDFKNLRDT